MKIVVVPKRTQTKKKTETRYYLQPSESLRDGIRRIFDEQLSAASNGLSNPGDSLDVAVHEARKCIKKVRSLLRLIRPVIPKIYDRENSRLRRVGRKLSELRDAQVLIETLDGLEKKTGGFPGTRRFLGARKSRIARRIHSSGGIASAMSTLEQTRKGLAGLPLQKLDFAVIVKSVKKTFRRGEEAFANTDADPSPDNFHECRKRVKDLRYQLGIWTEMWPDVLEAYVDSAKTLEQSLGDDHNLAILAEIVRRKNAASTELQRLLPLVEKRQTKLRDNAKRLATRLYAEPAKAWTARLEASWHAWRAESAK